MSDRTIAIDGVVKVFRRFQHPGWRAFDALGIRVPKSKYDEFVALDRVSMTVERGEKVALIGRNGAGKSTLLRVICGQMRPDSGRIQIAGNVQALMELGTGFHPEFTGVDNIRSALAFQGLAKSRVDKAIDEIVYFTELEEFIHRPVREYSAGMYARLAFAVATTVVPDILIVDEILGAGDAYFVGKCIQRMRNLTSEGATVLFVSHDMSSVQLLCDRGVWIDRGRVKADGDILNVSKLYLASVREDEEIRTRARSMSLSKAMVRAANAESAPISLFRLIGMDGRAPSEAFVVSEIRFGCGDRTMGTIQPEQDNDSSRMIAEQGATNWSDVEIVKGTAVRKFVDLGGRFVHAPWQIDWSGVPVSERWIELVYLASGKLALSLDKYDTFQQKFVQIKEILTSAAVTEWSSVRVMLPSNVGDEQTAAKDVSVKSKLLVLSSVDRYGSGPIKITEFGFFDSDGDSRHTLVSGEPASATMTYIAAEAVTDPVAAITLYRPDGTCALQVISSRSGMRLGTLEEKGSISATFDPLLLGPGDYIVTVALFKYLNLASRHEPEAYDLHDRCYALKILQPDGIGVDLGIVNQPAAWNIQR
ncbi:MAG: ABC transporter ATP-binding protein [Candidatus Dechloromonas phosphoritropha]